ncbi:hypothetical protein HMN09_00335000 [Mycena chlorophos]|uniref:Uncharacterized protein n=1 Tax=Mycena chlorophos TaxID=658473 RepID=A0A8H6TM96_MYCCL|nr:hypothetical protein HMN09_00335000 [Mycena chlorophos]
MNENAVPLYLMDPSRTLISPPPEEELQRNVFGPRSNSTTSMQSKRKRNGTPSKEATPNPKPRKQAHRHSPIPETDLSPTRAAFQRSKNPNADWLPPPSTSSARRSVTPYEPPTDVFKPPPEIIRATPVPAQKARANRQRTTTPQPRSRAQTPLRVIVQTSVKKEMPTIDLSRAMDPPSPTDDPLLLLPSSSPTRTRRSRSRNPPDSSSDLPAFDFTMGPLMDVTDLPTSDSMDLDEPIELPPRVAGPSDWDSDSDDEQEQADNGTLALPTIQLSQPAESLSPAPRPTTTTLSLANFLPTRSTTPPRARSQSRYSLSPAPLVPTEPAVIHEDAEEDDAGLSEPAPAPRTPPRSATTTNANESYTTVLRSTKLDPPTPETKARSDAWGIWGSPYPGRGRGLDGDSNGSFRMDGGFRRGRLLGDMSEEQGPSVDDMQAQAQEDEDEDEEMVEEGVSFFRALREEDEARAKEQQQQQEEEEEEMQQDDDEEEQDDEEEEVRRMSVEPEPVIAPMPIRPRPTYVPTEQPTASTSKQTETQTLPIRWKPARSDHVVTDQADTSIQSTSSSASTSSVSPGPSVFAGRGTRRPSEASGYVDAEKEIASVLSGRDYVVPIAGGDDDGDEEDEEDLLGLVKITSTDPRAAARAAAILKQHDYDCFTRLRDKDKNRRHSFAGVTKTNSSFSSSSPARPSSKVQDIAELQRKAEKERAKRVVKRRQSARVVGEKVWFPGSPAPVTTSQLLEEAEREVVSSGVSPKPQSTISAKASWDASVSTPVRPASASASVSGRRSSLAREIPLPESDSEEDTSHVREWTKADWKALDACFTDERIAVAERLGMVLNLSVAPPAKDANESFAFSTPVKQTVSAGAGADGNVVMMASVDAVDVAAVVERFEGRMGGRREMKGWGEAWDTETLLQRVRSLQVKQRSGHVAPPTPRSSAAIENASTSSIFSKRQATMEVPDFTPLGKRAMPPALSSASRRPRLPEPVLGGPFSDLPPTPEPAKRRRVPGSLLAPRYSHLLDEAKVVAGSSTTVQEQDEEEEEIEEQETEADTSGEQEHPETSFEDSSFEDVDAEMVPATPLREQPPAAPPAPATIGNRVKGFLFSYLPTLANTAPPAPPRTNLMHGRPRLPLPPLEILQKPRGPVTTPARPPLPKTTAPKDLVTLQQAPPPKTMIPRKAVVPKRMKDLKHVSPPPQMPPVREGPRPRTASGGSVKDLVKNFEAMDKGKGKAQEVKRVKSVGNLGNNGGAARRPAWR